MTLETNAVPAALFPGSTPVDQIHNALALLSVLRENYAHKDEDYPTWLHIGVVQDTIKTALQRM